MKYILAAFILTTPFLGLNAQDTCENAIPVDLGTHTVAAVDGTGAALPACTTNGQELAIHAEWYSFTATHDTTLLLTTEVSGQPQVNTRFHVYSGECGGLQCITGNDDGGANGTSRASFPVLEGITYLVAFDDRWSADGFSFNLSESYPIANMENYVSFSGSFINMQGLPMAVVDMTNDGLDDVVGVTQTSVNIQRQLPEGGFTSEVIVTDFADHPASWSLCAGDLDGNGYNDLLYGGGYGVTFMMASDDGTAFLERSGPEYVFSQRSNMVDINNDGHLDAFVCHDVAPNVYYLNDGTGELTFTQGGLGYSCGNYGSLWVDYDNDGDQDCFVAKCGCDPADLLMRNEGNGVFSQQGGALGFADGHQSWSSAWGDFDNDGDMDVLIGSSASGYHKLMRNDGDGTFTNVTAGSGLDLFHVQGIEWVTHDLDNDGLLDILGGYSLIMNRGNMTFAWNRSSPGHGGVGDLNNDGFLDVMGQNGLQFNNGNDNHWVRANLHGTVSNRNGIGARVSVTTASGTRIREIRSGEGFEYMSSLMAHFGLGQDAAIEELTVHWPSGIVQVLDAPSIDTVIEITEPVTTDLVDGPGIRSFSVYPNPALDRLMFIGSADHNGRSVTIMDISGRPVGRGIIQPGGLDISALRSGIYHVRMQAEGHIVEARFIKQ